jgi:hypothetical protein
LLARLALLTGALAAAWGAIAPIAFALRGAAGISAATLALGVCWIGAAAALAIASFLPGGSVHATGVAMLLRMFLTLGLGVTLHVQMPALAANGMIFYLIGFYMVALAIETALAVAQVSTDSHSPKAI